MNNKHYWTVVAVAISILVLSGLIVLKKAWAQPISGQVQSVQNDVSSTRPIKINSYKEGAYVFSNYYFSVQQRRSKTIHCVQTVAEGNNHAYSKITTSCTQDH